MNITLRFLFAMTIIVLSSLYIFPWKSVGIDFGESFINKNYTLGLDLQ